MKEEEAMEFGTVIGITAWDGCAPGTARVIKWDAEKNASSKTERKLEQFDGGSKESMTSITSKCQLPRVRKRYLNSTLGHYLKKSWPQAMASLLSKRSALCFACVLQNCCLKTALTISRTDMMDTWEWCDFKATVYVSVKKYLNGDVVLKEERFVRAPYLRLVATIWNKFMALWYSV